MKSLALAVLLAAPTFCFLNAQAGSGDDCRSCMNIPVPPSQALDLSAVSQYVNKEQMENITRELYQVGSAKDSKSVKMPIKVSKENFDPEKWVAKQKALPYDAPPDSALFLVFTMPSGFSTRTEGSSEVRGSSSASNTIINSVDMARKDGSSRHMQMKTIGETNQMTVEKGNREHSIEVSARVFQLLDNPDLMLYPVSNKVKNSFHDMIGAHNVYGDENLPSYLVDLRDLNGQSFDAKNGEVYILPLIVTFKNYKELEGLSRKDGKGKTTLVTGVQGSVPVDHRFSQAGAGAFANVIHDRELSQKLVLTIAAGLGVNIQRTLADGYQPTDRPTSVHWNGNFAVGLTCLGKGNEKTSVFITYDVKNPLLNPNDYKPATGARLTRLATDSSTDHDQAVGVAIAHQTEAKTIYQFECHEDFGGRSRVPGSIGGVNNRDFSCAASVRKPF